MSNYREAAIDDAKESIRDHVDEIAEYIIDHEKVPTDPLNDIAGFDEYHHSYH